MLDLFYLLPLLLLAGLLLWPRQGLLARWREGRLLAVRVRREDALKHIMKAEANRREATLESLAGSLQITGTQATDLVQELGRSGLLSLEAGRLGLTVAGRELATHVIRAHRLWESYLAEQTGVAAQEWHRRAERQEHLLTQQQTNALAAKLGHPTHDPHGDFIPEDGGELPAESGQPLSAAPLNTPLVIGHVEDEPAAIYSQLCAVGLRPGMKVVVLERTAEWMKFWADGTEHVLAPVLAGNLNMLPLPETKPDDLFEEEFLAQLGPGQRARILGLTPACRGAERRRLLDLGFVPGTQVEVEMVSPGGDPTAYRVRGTVIALRREQATLVRITTASEEAAAA
jgi:DtxR family Mn-dependent transcriptional regulator